jgi:hypothetical protein
MAIEPGVVTCQDSPMSHERYVEGVRREIAGIARSMVNGELSFIEGARQINDRRGIAELRDDLDMKVFILIDSETESIPIGSAARLIWAPEALARLEPEIAKKERWARDIAWKECRRLIDRFKDPNEYRVIVREVLMRDWDPYGIVGIPELVHEYDEYADRSYAMLVDEKATTEMLAGYFRDIEIRAGLDDDGRSVRVAAALVGWRSVLEIS